MDYSKYSINELLDCLNNIDKDAHPENYEKLILELEKRKPELEAFQKQEQEEFTFSTENRVKLLSWLQIATCVGFTIAFVNVLFGSRELIDLIVYGFIAVFNGLAGYKLLKRSRYGYELSYLNQILQILTINTGTLFFTYTGLGSFLIGIEGELFFRANILSTDFRFYTGENLGQFGFGVDLVAIFFLSVLHSCRELGLDTKANKAFKADS
ncbi:hypothetical protein [Pseudoalteromonas byunsanensis]|uniref:Uncharacterized protein n=1 Tax=Pseudoalteromonas byunsanensis TaxID=327939 RepID=A0A1S1N4M5_9GAMM|nr:hypothetical protein [Pseudoalteromonas byunsanensis]OHU94381.1 hypothetical protein BIW53_14985 [Pseudoalteromonas byunsanensis]